MKNKILTVIFIGLISLFPMLASFSNARGRIEIMDFPEPPRLSYPIYDKVDLKGKDYLEFSWWNFLMNVDHFEFRLYKGYNMYADDLILKEELAANFSVFKVKADVFTNGQVYTWSLIHVAVNGRKSEKSFNSFKVIK